MYDRRSANALAVFLIAASLACSEDAKPGTEAEPSSSTRDAEAEPPPARDGAAPPSDAATADLPELCSGCSDEERDASDVAAHFHHMHLNTHVRAESIDFYERVLGAQLVRLNGQADVLKADGALLLLNEVSAAPTAELGSGLEHFGWGRMDLPAWWQDAQAKDGVQLDQRSGTLDGPFALFPGYYFLYLQGPSNERVEVETETEEYAQFKHVHFMTDDVDGTVAWYTVLLGVDPEMPAAVETTLAVEFNGMPIAWSANTIIIDKVKMIFFGPPFFGLPERYVPSDDYPAGHVAFSFADLDAAVTRLEGEGVELLSAPALDEEHGFRSAFVRGPNEVLVELVEAGPLPNPRP